MLTDALNHPIRVGDTVLTNHYGVPTMGLLTKVVKITKRRAFVQVTRNIYKRNLGSYSVEVVTQVIPRYSHQMVVVNEQLTYNKKTFPEMFI